MANTNLEILKAAAAKEITPALVQFWTQKFEEIFSSKFRYEENTKIGFINLTAHLTSDKKDVDHQELQQTIATAIRFLDALIEDQEYRSIHLSVDNFEEFLKETDTAPQIGVDYIGGLIADFSYRASENLAHEKGSFAKFGTIPKHLRPVEYEMWVDKDQNYKNGQELSTMFDDVSLAASTWSLVPRRNFAILDFPGEPVYWVKWRDSYYESNKTDETMAEPEIIEDLSNSEVTESVAQGLANDNSATFDTDLDMPGLDFMSNDIEVDKIVAPQSNNQTEVNQHEDQNVEEVENKAQQHAQNFLDLTQESNDQEIVDNIEFDFDADLDNSKPELGEPQPVENYSVEVKNNTQSDVQPFEPVSEPDIQTSAEPVLQKADEVFLVGELVKVIDNSSPYFNDILQVIEVGDNIKLTGSDSELSNINFKPNQLHKQNLYELLDNLNHQSAEAADQIKASQIMPQAGIDYTNVISSALIINSKNQVLLFSYKDDADQNWNLPSAQIRFNQIPEESIVRYLQSISSKNPKIIDEVGSVMQARQSNQENSKNTIHNVFLIDLALDSDSDLEAEDILKYQYFDLADLPKVNMVVRVALDKHLRRQKLVSDICQNHMNDWTAHQKAELEEQLREEIQAQMNQAVHTTPQDMIAPEDDIYDTQPHSQSEVNTQTNQTETIEDEWDAFENEFKSADNNLPETVSNSKVIMPQESTMNAQLNNDKSFIKPTDNTQKFKLKLEKWLESPQYGHLGLSIGYGSKGIESLTLLDSSLEPELRFSLDIIIQLLNHLLSHGLHLNDLLSGLNLQHGNNEVKMSELLASILNIISSAPQKISQLNEDLLL